jgi:adenylate cyclase
MQRVQGWGSLSDDDIAEAVLLSRQALEAARDDPDTLWQAGYTLFLLAGEASVAEAMLDRAVTLNPNAAAAWSFKGNVLALRNRPDAAIEAVERARRLNPYDPNSCFNAFSTALAYLAARRFEDAIEWANRGLHDQPRSVTAMRVKTVASVHLGRFEEARAELGRVLAIDPSLTIARYRAMLGSSVAPELFELVVAGLRRAGLPEE